MKIPDAIFNLAFRATGTVLSSSGKNNKLLILMFHRVLPQPDPLLPHDVDVNTFDWQMGLIKHCFTPLSLTEAAHRLRTGTLPPRSVCVTFDDGYADNYHFALPVLKKYDIPATVFVAVGFIDGGMMWNDAIIETCRHAKSGVMDLYAIGLDRYPINTQKERLDTINTVIQRLKYLPMEERQAKVEKITGLANEDLPNNLMMTHDQLNQLSLHGIEIGAHTVSHPILSRMPLDQAEYEIIEGRNRLQDMLGTTIKSFAFPNGKPGYDYGPDHVRTVRQAGFDVAVSTAWGYASSDGDPYQLPRIAPWDSSSLRYGLRMLKTYIGKPANIV